MSVTQQDIDALKQELETLVGELGEGKSADCRKRIASILEDVKKECEQGVHGDANSAQETLMDRVRHTPACSEPKPARRKSKPRRRRTR
jgi:hypothetical protein